MRTLSLSPDLSFIFILYFYCMSEHALMLSLSTFSCIFLFSLCLAAPNLNANPHLFFILASLPCCFSLLVPLSPHLSCFVVLHFHCASCLLPSQSQADLFCTFILSILTVCTLLSLAPFIAASLATLNSISVHMFSP